MIWQYLILGVILGGAVYYLWRVFFRRSSGGGCCGSGASCGSPAGDSPSAGCGCDGGCGPNPPLAGPPSLPPEREDKQK